MPRISKRAQALRDLCRFQESRLLHRVVNTLTAESSSSSSSSGGLGLQPMEIDERIQQDMPPPDGIEHNFDLSEAWPPLLAPDEPVQQDHEDGYCPDCSTSSSSDDDNEDEAFLDELLEVTHLALSSSRYFGDRTPRPSLPQEKWKAILEED